MLQFTREIDYGLQLLTRLVKSKKGQLLSLRVFAKEAGISFLFLQRIAQKLKTAGIIDAAKGVSGGYFLKISPKKLLVEDVMEALEGDCNLADCVKNPGQCKKGAHCDARKIFCKINTQFIKCLREIKISDII